MKNGEIKKYHSNGKLIKISNWKNDKLDGECKLYKRSGKLLEISNWKDGKREGEERWYFKNGYTEITYWKNGEDITKQVLAKRELLERIKEL